MAVSSIGNMICHDYEVRMCVYVLLLTYSYATDLQVPCEVKLLNLRFTFKESMMECSAQ